MGIREIIWLLSGDTTVMVELLEDTPEIMEMAQKVADKKASYDELLNLSYEFF